jgi:hypothetical protein
MKSNPGSALIHIAFKRFSLLWLWWPGVKKYYELIPITDTTIQFVPVGCGVVDKVIGFRLRT